MKIGRIGPKRNQKGYLFFSITFQYTIFGFPVHSSTSTINFQIFPVHKFSSKEKGTFTVHFSVHFSLQCIPVHSSKGGHPVHTLLMEFKNLDPLSRKCQNYYFTVFRGVKVKETKPKGYPTY